MRKNERERERENNKERQRYEQVLVSRQTLKLPLATSPFHVS